MKKSLLILILLFILNAAAVCAEADEISDNETLYFDFGTYAEPGWRSVDVSCRYSPEGGFGFSSGKGAADTAASGGGVLSDAVIWKEETEEFCVDLPNGMYKLGIYAGDIKRMSIKAEGYYAVMNMTGNGCFAPVEIPVTDGTLNICAVSSTLPKEDAEYALSALTITKLDKSNPRKKRLFVCGDSIASDYYPVKIDGELRESYQGGWGQMLENYIPSEFYVHNYATGGQTAQGFLNEGQFDAVEHFMEQGDYCFISFGINDQSASTEEEFGLAVTEMVQRVQAKGGIPVIISNHGKLEDYRDDGVFYTPDRWFKNTAKKISDHYGIPYVDLHKLAAAYFTAIGYEDTEKLYWIAWSGSRDQIHVNREGAGHLARLICEELRRLGQSEFSCYKLPPYGMSGDITLKCESEYAENSELKIKLQNLAPSAETAELVVCSYADDGSLLGTAVKRVTLPGFDVRDTSAKAVLTVSDGERVFLVKNGRLTALNSGIWYGFDVPYIEAEKLK